MVALSLWSAIPREALGPVLAGLSFLFPLLGISGGLPHIPLIPSSPDLPAHTIST